MDDDLRKITPELIIEVAKRRRWVILLPICLALIGGIYYAKVAPRIYEAKTLILVEGQSVPQNYVRSIVTENTNERINTISQQILSRTNLEKIVQQFSLFSGPNSKNMYMEDKVNILRNNISVDVITDRRRQTDAFEISFRGQDPNKVMQVVNGLTASFIDENLKVRESLALGTSSFLESELETIRNNLELFEGKIKDYRKKHMGELPDQLDSNLRILGRLQDNLSNRQQNLREAKIRLADLENRAATSQSQEATSVDDMIAELATLQSRYTDKHPDIIRLKKQIAEMKSQQADKTGAGHRATNYRLPPAIRGQVDDLHHDIMINEIESQRIEAQIATYQQRVENTPKREQELQTLTRDYDNIQKSYDSLLNRKLEANIAVNMERKQKGEQFRIVDPAKLPKRPVEPDLQRLFLLIVSAGLGIGGGLAVLLEFLDTSFRNADNLEKAFALPVLASLPMLIDQKQILVRRMNNIGSIAMVCMNVLLLGVLGMVSM